MRRSPVSLAFALFAVGCAARQARAPSPVPARPTPLHVEVPRQAAPVTGCRATPSTVYGDEPVVFELQAPGGPAQAEVELLDQRGHALVWETIAVPGAWRPADVGSGDFALQLGSSGVTCQVTVNRELARATETAR